MILSRLGKLVQQVEAVYAPEVISNGEFLTIRSDFEGKAELLSKVEVMGKYTFDQAVAIGNGITDVNMARNASVVFARDFLAQWLSDRGVAFYPWQDFNDVRKKLGILWKTAHP